MCEGVVFGDPKVVCDRWTVLNWRGDSVKSFMVDGGVGVASCEVSCDSVLTMAALCVGRGRFTFDDIRARAEEFTEL